MDYGEFFSEAGPPLGFEAREAAWAALGAEVPSQLAALYASTNGGLTHASVVPLPGGTNDTVLNVVFALGGETDYPMISEEAEALADTGMMPGAALAFAEDPGGNVFAVALDTQDFGKVFFVDHEVWVEAPAKTLRESANATPVAKDLVTFFATLTEDQS